MDRDLAVDIERMLGPEFTQYMRTTRDAPPEPDKHQTWTITLTEDCPYTPMKIVGRLRHYGFTARPRTKQVDTPEDRPARWIEARYRVREDSNEFNTRVALTTEQPQEPGWYWLKKPGEVHQVVKVIWNDDAQTQLAVWLQNVDGVERLVEGALWSPRLPEPQAV